MTDPSPFRRLPPVHGVVAHPDLREPIERLGRERVLDAIRATLDDARLALAAGDSPAIDLESIVRRTFFRLDESRPSLREVLNGTGVLLNTGLGRAPLAREAIEAIDGVARGYCNLEFDLDRGERGKRSGGVEGLLGRLVGSEAAAVVNNNAAATILALRALAFRKDAIVSRGQLVEIGGSFRLPEIFEVSGARLREVGTTNKTRLVDYERAIGPDTAALMRVHASNYKIVGFTESVPIRDLAALGRARGLWTIDDIGSGAIAPGRPPNVSDEPTVREGLEAGADLVLFSGDKLLGGPQCGLLVGRKSAVQKVQADPLMRALRVDKLTLAALEATLFLHLDPAHARSKVPLWAFLTTPAESLRLRAEALAETLRRKLRWRVGAVATEAMIGGGSVPVDPLPSWGLRIEPDRASGWNDDSFLRALRLGNPSVVGRARSGAVLVDLRAIFPSDDDRLAEAIVKRTARPDGPGREGDGLSVGD